MPPIKLSETGAGEPVALDEEQATLLEASGLVVLTRRRESGWWTVAGKRGRVGAFRLGDLEFWVMPKMKISRLLFLAGYARNPAGWRDELIATTTDEGVVPAVAQTLWRQAEEALRLGLLHGYRQRDESATALRGRIRLADQLRRRFDQPLPMEIQYDDFTPDIAENRILLAAIEHMLTVPGVDRESAARLHALRGRFEGVQFRRSLAQPPKWTPSRLNERYHTVLELAEVILQTRSPEHSPGALGVNGFMFNLETIFEDFVTTSIATALGSRVEGWPSAPYYSHLDKGNEVTIKLDMVWNHRDRPVAAVDAKYKGKRNNDNLFQMLAYCTALGLRQGHLVYARGTAPLRTYQVKQGGVELFVHAIDLTAPRGALLDSIDRIADQIAGHLPAAHGRRTGPTPPG
ncbi:McrC family protein [Amycolatopsis sp. cmx-4-61]|uniref:McrC family protein n=1 Tax=Amycolatopsis sp. cmx-4-61 TaxID=2790937 RepID=UPI00397BAD91